QVDAERGPEERLLDVVRGEAVAGEERLDVAAADETGEVRPAAGVDHDRTGDHHDLAAAVAQPAHLPGDPVDGELDAALARGLGGHEAEGLAGGGDARRVDADALDAADDAVAHREAAEQAAARARATPGRAGGRPGRSRSRSSRRPR